MLTPFHLAIPVNNLAAAAKFYGDVLACKKGRSDSHWIDWNFFGHQLVTHLVEAMPKSIMPNEVDSKAVPKSIMPNEVDSKAVPVPHFGVVLQEHQWLETADKIKANGIAFVIEPYIRFKGKTGEQGTFFLYDPAGNALEFKYFNDMTQVFAV